EEGVRRSDASGQHVGQYRHHRRGVLERLLHDPGLPTGQLDRADLDLRAQRLVPGGEGRAATTRVREADQSQSGLRSRDGPDDTDAHLPRTAGKLRGLADARLLAPAHADTRMYDGNGGIDVRSASSRANPPSRPISLNPLNRYVTSIARLRPLGRNSPCSRTPCRSASW